MSLKLRLNLIITTLLLFVMMVAMVLNIINARQNVRAEVASTEKLALYLFDNDILQRVQSHNGHPLFRLKGLNQIRHLRIEFYDVQGQLIDSNITQDSLPAMRKAPHWFERVMAIVTPKWQLQHRDITYQGQLLGRLVITPDPSYEYVEIWKQITDLFWVLSVFSVLVNLMIVWAVGQALKPTETILLTLNSLESGNLRARMPAFDLPELERIGVKFNHMVEVLEQSTQRNHLLSQQLMTLQEAERKSLARDLHDEFGQCLTAIHADATVILRVAEEKQPEILDSAKAITQLTQHLMTLVRGLLQRFRPEVLDALGLSAALQDLVETWKGRNQPMVCNLVIGDDVPTVLEDTLQITLYRLVQECLTNVTRHAQATKVDIQLTIATHPTEIPKVLVVVQDDGRGFNAALEGFGLLGMRERIGGLGGQMHLHTGPEQGTKISAWLPLMRNRK